LVSSSDTTMAISWLRSAAPHRRTVAMVKSRATRTDPGSAPIVRVAIRGGAAHIGRAESGDGSQPPLTRPAISAASESQPKPSATVVPSGVVVRSATVVRPAWWPPVWWRPGKPVRAPARCH
jgi:hypothetical protein